MGELIQFPFGARRAPLPAARLTADLLGDQARTVDGSICATYVELLDDLLLRHQGLGSTLAGHYGDTAGIWLADAHKLRAEIARRPANIRMAVGIAERVGQLAGAIAALEQQGTEDVDQAHRPGALKVDETAFMRDARVENEKLKSRLLPVNRAAVTPPSDVAAEVDGARPAEMLPVPFLVRTGSVFRARRNAAWTEACSAAYHLANAARAIGALIALGFRSPNRIDHRVAPRLVETGTLGEAARRVIRRRVPDFRTHADGCRPSSHPTGGSAA